MKRKDFLKSMSAPSVVSTVALMRDGVPRTVREICAILDFALPTCHAVMLTLEFNGMAHIKDYSTESGCRAPIWVFGPGKSAGKRAKQTREERLKQMKAWRDANQEKKLEPRRATNFNIARDPLVAAFFGECRAVSSTLIGRIYRQSMEAIEDEQEAA